MTMLATIQVYGRRLLALLLTGIIASRLTSVAAAGMAVDISDDDVRQTLNTTYLEDLAVNDTALIYSNFCLQDGALFVPGWTQPAALARDAYTASGVILRVEVLPGRQLRGTYVDALQAQQIAKGNVGAPSAMSPNEYNQNVRQAIARIFQGGIWGTETCDQERGQNPLRKLTLFEVVSINGFTRLSELLNHSR
jgi:hypothetical protein